LKNVYRTQNPKKPVFVSKYKKRVNQCELLNVVLKIKNGNKEKEKETEKKNKGEFFVSEGAHFLF